MILMRMNKSSRQDDRKGLYRALSKNNWALENQLAGLSIWFGKFIADINAYYEYGMARDLLFPYIEWLIMIILLQDN